MKTNNNIKNKVNALIAINQDAILDNNRKMKLFANNKGFCLTATVQNECFKMFIKELKECIKPKTEA